MWFFMWVFLGAISILVDYKDTRNDTWEWFDIVIVGLSGPIFLIVYLINYIWRKKNGDNSNV